MSKRIVRWMPLCHVPHGYRRVFVVYEDDQLKNIIVMAHMGYEDVYNVQQMIKGSNVKDPALLWGLSFVKAVIDTDAVQDAEDGYYTTRPQRPTEDMLISDEAYQEAFKNGEFILE